MKLVGNSRSTKIIVDIFMTIFLVLSFVRWNGDSGFIFHAIVGAACTLFFYLTHLHTLEMDKSRNKVSL